MSLYAVRTILCLWICCFCALEGKEWRFETKNPKQPKPHQNGKTVPLQPIREVNFQRQEPVRKVTTHPVPPWMYEQIEHDLAPFKKKGITSAMLDQIWEERGMPKTQQYVRFIYKDGQLLFCLADIPDDGFGRLEAVKEAFERLNKEQTLPDFDLILTLHDEYSGPLPLWAFAKNKYARGGVLMPDFEALTGYHQLRADILAACHQYPWNVKLKMGFWRGSSTGGDYRLDNWETKPRAKLVLHSIYNPRDVDARFTSLVQMNDATRYHLSAHGFLGMFAAPREHLRYKYIVEVDGNSCSYSRCYWELLSNSVMFKQVSDNIQWYYGALYPYEHFIPLASDLSDFLQMIYWARAHDEECKEIAARATAFAIQELSPENIDLYLRLLIEEYAKICHVSVKDRL